MHPYLKERLRDLLRHGYCKIENEMITDPALMAQDGPMEEWGDQALYELALQGKAPIITQRDDGLEVRAIDQRYAAAIEMSAPPTPEALSEEGEINAEIPVRNAYQA